MKKLVTLLTTTLAMLVVFSCSKKSESGTAASVPTGAFEILSLPVVKKIPLASNALIVWDFRGKAAKEFSKSRWANQQGSMLKGIEGVLDQTPATNPGRKVLEWMLQSKLFASTAGKPALDQGAMFMDIDQKKGGFYAMGSGAVDYSDETTKLANVLREEGLEITEKAYGKAKGFMAKYTDASKGPLPFTIHFAATKTEFAATSTEVLTSNLFSGDSPDATQALQKTERFKRALKELPQQDRLLNFMYFDVQKMMETAQSFIPAGQMQAASFSPKDLPFESIVAASRIDGQLSGMLSMPLRADRSNKEVWKKLANLPSDGAVSSSVPKNALFFLSLNGEIFKAIQEVATKNMPPQQAQQVMQVTALLSSIKDVGLGVTNLPGGALFPSVFLLANSSESTQLHGQLKALLQAQGQAANLPASSWKTKQIEGATVDYTLSPLGIGAYLANHNNQLLVGTTETVVKDSLQSSSAGDGLLKSLSPGARSLVQAKTPPLAMMYANFEGVADLVDSLQNNMAMFTGGQSQFDTSQIDSLRKLGKVVGTVRISDTATSVQSIYFE